MEKLVFFDTCFNIVSVQLRIDLLQSSIVDVVRLLPALDASIL